MIMEQVEYPGMCGTNTMCVVTALLETGMLPMTEPVTELTLEAPAGLIRVRADVPRRQGDRRHVPERAGVRDPPRRPRGGPAASARSRSTSPTAGCSTSSPSAEAFGLRLTPDEGADIVRITEMIKAAADDQLPGRPPRAAGVRRDHDRPAVRARPRPGERDAQRRHGLDRGARLGPARDLDRGDRPLAVRDRDLGADGDAPCPGPAGDRRGLPPRRDPRHGVHRPAARGGAHRATDRAVVPQITGQAWITGIADYVVDPTDPFPDGFTVGDIWA